MVAGIWLIELIDTLFLGHTLIQYGIRPRRLASLWRIPLAPLLHGNFAHLMANTAPLFLLGWLVMLRKTSDFFVVTGFSTLVGGLGIWLFGAPQTVHLGASILIFGYLGYLLGRGYFERSSTSLIVALVAGILYGGALWGILPGRPGISWQGHLFGFLGGVWCAKLMVSSWSSGALEHSSTKHV